MTVCLKGPSQHIASLAVCKRAVFPNGTKVAPDLIQRKKSNSSFVTLQTLPLLLCFQLLTCSRFLFISPYM